MSGSSGARDPISSSSCGPFVSPSPPAHPPGGVGTTAALAIDAGRRALESAGTTGEEISLLILCTTSPDQAMPATSSAVAHHLGIGGGAMDLNAACAGFTYGLVTAAALVSSGVGNVLLVGAETMTRVTNWEDRSSAFLFGDGAGAVVLKAVPGPGSLLGSDLGADGSLVELLYADHGSGMVMRGREVFRQAVRATTDSANVSLRRAEVEPREIALFVPHQANRRIMDAVAERLGIPGERIASVVDNRQHQRGFHPACPRRCRRQWATQPRRSRARGRIRSRDDLGISGMALG